MWLRPALLSRARVLALTLTLALGLGAVAGLSHQAAEARDGASVASGRAEPSRAVWVWTRPPVAELVAYAGAHDVDTLYVAVPPDADTHPTLPWYRRLHRAAHGAGLELQALGSANSWTFAHSRALEWQRDALRTGLFDGVHYDVEPWTTDAWRVDRDRTARRYLGLLRTLTADTSRPVEADLAFWLDTVRVDGTRFDRAVLDLVDGATIMTYRRRATGPDSVASLGRAAVAAGHRAGVPVRLAVETMFLGRGPIAVKQTFHGLHRARLDRALGRVDAAYADSPAYAGMVVHDYDGWTAMRR